jgi:hypothetical protein
MSVRSRCAECLRRGPLSERGVESAAQLPFGAYTPLRYRKVGEATAEP